MDRINYTIYNNIKPLLNQLKTRDHEINMLDQNIHDFLESNTKPF